MPLKQPWGLALWGNIMHNEKIPVKCVFGRIGPYQAAKNASVAFYRDCAVREHTRQNDTAVPSFQPLAASSFFFPFIG